MAKLYADAAGEVLRVTRTDADDALRGAPPGAAASLTFDEASNAALVDDLSALDGSYTLTGGTLRKAGNAVTPAADSAAKSELDALLGAAAQAVADNATYLALASPSNAQNLAQIRALTQQMTRVIRRLARLGRLQG